MPMKITSARPIERTMQRIFACATVLVLTLLGVAYYVGNGPVTWPKVTVVGIVMPLACIASLWLMIAARRVEESSR